MPGAPADVTGIDPGCRPFAVPSDDAPLNADSTVAPMHTRARTWANRITAVVACAVYVWYLGYRALYTINLDAPAFSLVLYVAEIHGFLALFLHFFQLWHPLRRTPPAPPANLSVDVFITTYDEDVTLLRQTIRGALAMRGAHTTYVLDDGRRPAVRALCEELGCRYVTRSDSRHAKAGNWNNAFRQTTGDVIVSLDADHVPRPEFLERTLGFFRDPRVWLVQTPQEFHNIDSLQHQVNWESRRMGAEHDTFFRLLMPGKDRWNAAFFCGTNAVLRRAALAPHGGLITGCVTEDIHTSIVLHGEGWRSVYVNETLATGLAPHDVDTFLKQRLRWAEGNLKILRLINPLTCDGLTLAQRICYGASVFYWTTGIPKIIFYVAPPLMLFTGIYPTANFDSTFMAVYAIFFASLLISFKTVSGRMGRLIQAELFAVLNVFTMLQAVGKLLVDGRREGIFVVTSKRGGSRSGASVVSHFVLLAISVYGFAWGALRLHYEITDDVLGQAIAMFWTACNAAFVVAVLRMALRQPQRRYSTRFRGAFVVERIATGGGSSMADIGVTADISEGGCRLLWAEPLPVGTELSIRLHLGGRALPIRAEVRTATSTPQRGYFPLSLGWVGVTSREIDAINDAIFDLVIPDLFNRLSEPSAVVAFARRFARRLRVAWRSRHARHQVVLPVRLRLGDRAIWATSRDISLTGLRVVAGEPIPRGAQLAVDVHTAGGVLSTTGVAVWSSPITHPGRHTTLCAIGVRLDAATDRASFKRVEVVAEAA